MDNKILTLAKKLKALADNGFDGERDNAMIMLKKIMEKHSITMDMIEDDFKKEHTFHIYFSDYKFFTQILANVLGSAQLYYSKSEAIGRKNKRRYYVRCTPAEAVEIQAKFDFYIVAWKKDLDTFYSAFIQKNKLYKKPSDDDKTDSKELTPEEREEIYKMSKMMEGLEQHKFFKQIEN